MDVFVHTAAQMVILFLLLFGGVIARRMGYMNDRFDTLFSRIIMNIALPCMILNSALSNENLPDAGTIVLILASSALVYVLICVIAWAFPRLFRHADAASRGAHSFIVAFGNVGFIGFPVLNAVFGPEAVFYGAIYNIPYNIAIFTVGAAMIRRGAGASHETAVDGLALPPAKRFASIFRSLATPVMFASLASIALALGHVTDAGGIVGQTMSYMGQLTVPGSMLIVGSSLAKMSFRSTLGHLLPYLSSLMRLLVIPVAVYLVFRSFISDQMLLGVLTISSGMPVATMGTMLCLVNGGDVGTMMRGTFITTVLSIVTIPVLAILVV